MSALVPGALSASLVPVTGAQNVAGIAGSDSFQRAQALMNGAGSGQSMPQRIADNTQNFLQSMAQPMQAVMTAPQPQPMPQPTVPARFGSALTAPQPQTVQAPRVGGSALTQPMPVTPSAPARFGSALTAPRVTSAPQDVYSLKHMLADVQALRRFYQDPRGINPYTPRSLGQVYSGLDSEYTRVPGGYYKRF